MTASSITATRSGDVTRAAPWAHPWVRFAARRLGRLLVSLWVLVTASFAMIHLIPGDPVRGALGPTAPAELVEARRRALGLDQPILTQYLHYLKGLLDGDLGTSLSSQLPVSDVNSIEGVPALRAWKSSIFVRCTAKRTACPATNGGYNESRETPPYSDFILDMF